MRKLVTLKEVTAITAIANADNIELLTIDNSWRVIAKRGEFVVGDLTVYHEIDSLLPVDNPAYAFLIKGDTPYRLRTIKLRGCLSQGLALPLSMFSDYNLTVDDIAAALGVTKYEPPFNAGLAGNAKGSFPSFIPKTDQERAQNLVDVIFTDRITELYEITIKLDGSSMTAYHNNGSIGVCSRNLELKLEDNPNNAFVSMFASSGLQTALTAYGKNIAVQGELIGSNIQGNREQLLGHEFYIYDIYDIDNQRYLRPYERLDVLNELRNLGYNQHHVPILGLLKALPCDNLDGLLLYADGESLHNSVREGLVYKSHDSQFRFKTISNKFLLRGGE